MANFHKALPIILEHEGCYVNDPKDSGGATKWGISLSYLKKLGELGDINKDGIVDFKDITALTKEEAEQFYLDEWWNRYCYDLIEDQIVATKIFDIAINIGPSGAHRLAQSTVNQLYPALIKMDGIIGCKTIEAINNCNPEMFLKKYKQACIYYYCNIVQKNPDKVKFLVGWINRAQWPQD